jgi:ubiquinone/menaquinone biosynthesis C-methylase UbiE
MTDDVTTNRGAAAASALESRAVRDVTTLERMYGQDDLAESPVFGGGFCNFGFWRSPPRTHSPRERAEASAALYQEVFESLGQVDPRARAVEVGVGRGWGARMGIEQFRFESIVGVDVSPEQIDRLRRWQGELVDDGRLEGRVGRAESLPVEAAACDALYSVEALQHVESQDAFAREAARVLRPDGALAVTTFFLREPGDLERMRPLLPTVAKGITRPTTVEELTRSLERHGFRDVQVREIGAHVFPAFDAWLAIIGERAAERDNWGRNWLKGYEGGLIDYSVVTAVGGANDPS